MPRRPKPKLGDVFSLPIDDTRVGVGQVVATWEGDVPYFAIYDTVAPDPDSVDVDQALRQPVLFLAQGVDYHEHWTILGNHPVRSGLPLPAYRRAWGSTVHVVDYSGARGRPATDEENSLLPNPRTFSPASFGNALKAKHGLREWLDGYHGLVVPRPEATTRAMFGDVDPVASVQSAEPDEPGGPAEHIVHAHFTLGGSEYGTEDQREVILSACRELDTLLQDAGLGDIDGNEFGNGEAIIYAFGPDADALFTAMQPRLREVPFRPAHAVLSYGGTDRDRVRVEL